MKKHAVLIASILTLTACQTLKQPTQAPATTAQTDTITFNIAGKIGVTTQTAEGRSSGSAFYGWKQEGERFAINLTGAFGVGATQIRYDGVKATLVTDKAQLEADNPNDLLFKVTGWHAPIDKLPYWVMGKPAQGDTDSVFDNGNLTQSKNGDWLAVFNHQDGLPSRITMTHKDGHKAVIVINHAQ